MKRREFIAALGGAATWPVVASAQQQRERMRRIGVLMALASDDPEGQARLAAFAQGLQQSGWVIGQNIRVDYRWSGGNADKMRNYAAELVAAGPDVILAHSSGAVAPLLQATNTIPVVFAIVADPVGAGFVAKPSAARPQRYWLYQLRIFHGGEMAGAAQRNLAPFDARGGPSRIRRWRLGLANSAQSKLWRNLWASICGRSMCAMPPRSNATLHCSRRG